MYLMGAEASWRAAEAITLDFSRDKCAMSSSEMPTIQRRGVCHRHWDLRLLSDKDSFRRVGRV